MMYAQYCRLESKAGGVFATDRKFIRACLSVIRKRSRYSRKSRTLRHKWIREGLKLKDRALLDYFQVMGGHA